MTTSGRAARDPGDVVALQPHAEWPNACHRELYERAIRTFGYDPYDVTEVRISESAIEVDAIDFTDPDWPTRTTRHELASSSLRSPDGPPVRAIW